MGRERPGGLEAQPSVVRGARRLKLSVEYSQLVLLDEEGRVDRHPLVHRLSYVDGDGVRRQAINDRLLVGAAFDLERRHDPLAEIDPLVIRGVLRSPPERRLYRGYLRVLREELSEDL